ncbi:type IX secretion system outer membrane channel protein PorV [Fulvivirga sp. M361]|uniref:type IX secretion system outer membrane channel protein PorV n=1 Tax=Fulvivirga sp. M361 TaxID=2594266 RepID=UPI00117AF673|nr:type IX secretion system outer membrane channel protein PorV [Fulvivirga sp. M361]TRX61239.1 type IX secretion system outer membrane channel protein PorV [Fulvivirga sp. M361]
MRHLILFSIVLCFFGTAIGQNNPITGQDSTQRAITTAVPFLMITPDARAGGMGDAGVATTPDANSVHWNPAKLAFIEDSDIGFSVNYTPWLGKIINDMSIVYVSGYYKFTKEQAVAVSMRYFDLGEILFTLDQNDQGTLFNPREFAFDATYSRMLSQNLGIGGTLRFIHSNLTGSFSSGGVEARPGSSAAVDVAVYYNKDLSIGGGNSNLALGANISNIGGKLTYSDENNRDFIPTNLRFGGALTTDLDPYNKITFALDFNKLLVPSPQFDGSEDDKTLLSGIFGSFGDAEDGFSEELQEITLSAGVEYWYNNQFAARVGYFLESEDKGNRKYLTVGLGFRYQVFGLDFAYLVPQEQEHPLAETLRFSLLFAFNKTTKDEESIID